MGKRLLSILALSILVASTLGGCSPRQSTPSPAIFSTSGGNVSVIKEGTASWVEAEVGMSLGPGDIIKSGDNSSAEVTFLDGSTIGLQAGTEVEVVSVNISKDAGSATIGLKQTIGSIIFRVTKLVDPASRYEVETPTGVVAVRGSAMEVYVIEDGTTRACSLEGDIWAIAQGVELQIPEGRCCVIRPGQPPRLICDLTVSSSTGGTVTVPGEGTFPYDEGTVADLVAQAEEGYRFVNWTGDVSTVDDVNASSAKITMDDIYSITANFEAIPPVHYSLTISSTAGGVVTSPGQGTFTYNASTVVNLVASPLGCYYFVNWIGDVGTIANVNSASTTISMNGNYSIIANFATAPCPSIDVQKYVRDSSGTYVDADTAPGPYIPAPITSNFTIFRFTIANSGNVALTNVYLSDTDMSAFYTDEACNISATFPTTLALFETKTYYGELIWASGQQSDTATAVGRSPVGDVNDNDPAYYFGS
jgi:hypothetical protein